MKEAFSIGLSVRHEQDETDIGLSIISILPPQMGIFTFNRCPDWGLYGNVRNGWKYENCTEKQRCHVIISKRFRAESLFHLKKKADASEIIQGTSN